MKIRDSLIALIFTVACGAASASELTLSGSGTADSPYLVGSASDWNALAAYMSDNTDYLTGKYVQITADIDFTDTGVTAISTFGGNLDGNSKTLSGISVTLISQYTAALINVATAEANIHDLSVDGTVSSSYTHCAVAVSQLYGTISNVTNYATFNGYGNSGSIVSDAMGATVTDCVNKGTVTYSLSSSGGVIGSATSSSVVSGCVNEGTVSSSSTYLGGVIGSVTASSSATSCVNKGTVSSTGKYAGGVFGSTTAATITDCRNEGTFTSSAVYLGGVTGNCGEGCVYENVGNLGTVQYTGSTASCYMGGVIGETCYGTFTRCYNEGTVTSTKTCSHVAGVFGDLCSDDTYTITGCYNTGDITVAGCVAGIISCTSTSTIVNMSDCYNTGNITATSAGTSYTCTVGISTMYNSGSTYTNCWNTGDITSNAGRQTAGLFGVRRVSGSNTTIIKGCYNTGKIYSTSGYYAGGILAQLCTSNTTMDSCYNTGSVSGYAYIGGIAAYVASGGSGTSVTNCYNTGNIDANCAYAGGIAGYLSTDSITKCFNTGDVTSYSTYLGASVKGNHAIGGIVGSCIGGIVSDVYNTGSITGILYVGGILGHTNTNSILGHAYSIGVVEPSSTSAIYGNIVGSTDLVTSDYITDTYYLAANAIEGSDSCSTALSYAQLAQLDLGDGWIVGDNYTYPRLATLDNAHSRAHAAAVIPADDDTYDNIRGSFYVGSPEGIAWTSSTSAVTVTDTMASFTGDYTGEFTMTATCDSVSVTTTLVKGGSTVYWLSGVYNNWDTSNSIDYSFYNGGTSHTLSLDEFYGEFKIITKSGDVSYGCGTIALDSLFTLSADGSSISLPSATDTYTGVVFTVVEEDDAVKLKVTATDSYETELVYYLSGDMNDWAIADSQYRFTDNGDGTFTLVTSGDSIGTSTGFKIVTQNNIQLGNDSGTSVSLETPYSYSTSGGTAYLSEASTTGELYFRLALSDGAYSLIASDELVTIVDYVDGYGTTRNPFLIGSAAQWDILRAYTVTTDDTLTGKHVQITNDIDFSKVGIIAFDVFDGELDGNGKTLYGISETLSTYIQGGLINIATWNAYIHDITVEADITTAYEYCSSVVGFLYGKIENVTTKGTFTTTGKFGGAMLGNGNGAVVNNCTNYATVTSSGTCAGGLIGGIINSTITNCCNYGTVQNIKYLRYYTGGIGGYVAHSEVSNCFNYGEISAMNYSAGLFGYTCMESSDKYDKTCVFTDCVNYGRVSITLSHAGGITAYAGAGCEYYNCGNKGEIVSEVTASQINPYLGGCFAELAPCKLVGCYNEGTFTNPSPYAQGQIAGLTAEFDSQADGEFVITDCYNAADIMGHGGLSGLFGTESYIYDYDYKFTITGCYNTGNITACDTTSSTISAAGITSYVPRNSTFTDCWNSGNITSTGDSTSCRIGGLFAGTSWSSSLPGYAQMKGCRNTGDITATGGNVGGIFGRMSNVGDITVDSCYNTGDITTTCAPYVGGIAGRMGSDSDYDGSPTITRCWNGGDITADSCYVGGVVGYNGIADTISACFNTGNITSATATIAAGGIAGYSASRISDVYNAGAVSGTQHVGGLVGLPEPKSTTIYTGYNSGKLTALADTTVIGNIVGVSTDDATAWKSGNTLSKTYYLSEWNAGGTDSYSTPITPAALASLDLGDSWIAGDGYTYPRIAEISDNDYACAFAAAIIPADGDSYSNITTRFNAGQADGVYWTSEPGIVNVYSNVAYFSQTYTSELVMTAHCGEALASTTLTCNVDESGISSIDIDDAKTVVSEKFYTTSGLLVGDAPADSQKAIYIVVRTFSDGTTETVKEAR